LKSGHITNLNIQVPVQIVKHAQRFWSQILCCAVSNWLYFKKGAFHISTGCNWLWFL